MSDTNLENMMVKLRQKGLKAVEVYYSTHSNSDTQHVMAMANRVGLYIQVAVIFTVLQSLK